MTRTAPSWPRKPLHGCTYGRATQATIRADLSALVRRAGRRAPLLPLLLFKQPAILVLAVCGDASRRGQTAGSCSSSPAAIRACTSNPCAGNLRASWDVRPDDGTSCALALAPWTCTSEQSRSPPDSVLLKGREDRSGRVVARRQARGARVVSSEDPRRVHTPESATAPQSSVCVCVREPSQRTPWQRFTSCPRRGWPRRRCACCRPPCLPPPPPPLCRAPRWRRRRSLTRRPCPCWCPCPQRPAERARCGPRAQRVQRSLKKHKHNNAAPPAETSDLGLEVQVLGQLVLLDGFELVRRRHLPVAPLLVRPQQAPPVHVQHARSPDQLGLQHGAQHGSSAPSRSAQARSTAHQAPYPAGGSRRLTAIFSAGESWKGYCTCDAESRVKPGSQARRQVLHGGSAGRT